MPAIIELTLQELAKIALGTPELTHVNIEVLHSLINMILKKLDCQNEKVSMSGLEAKCLEKVLSRSKPSPLPFNDEHLESISTKLDRIIELEERVIDTGDKLEQHFIKIEQCKKVEAIPFDIHKWEEFSSGTGKSDRCLECTDFINLEYRLLNYYGFLVKMQRRIIMSTVSRQFSLEEKVEKLHDDLVIAIKEAAKNYAKLALIDGCMLQIEHLDKEIDLDYLRFLKIMEEIQEMLDLKLDKIRVPAIKKYLVTQFKRVRVQMQGMQQPSVCPSAPGTISKGITCLSCGGKNICVDLVINPVGVLPDWQKKHKRKHKFRKECTCKYSEETEYIAAPTVKRKSIREQEKIKSTMNVPVACRVYTCPSFQLMEGTDGSLYRKG